MRTLRFDFRSIQSLNHLELHLLCNKHFVIGLKKKKKEKG